MKNKKISKFVVISLLLSILLSSCRGNSEETTQHFAYIDPILTDPVTDARTEKPYQVECNDPLTGEVCNESIVGKKCVAVMIKNDKKASPQLGLSDAGIVYEAPVEGGLTRFVALYSDAVGFDYVAPVIDSRWYFYTLASSHDPIFVQAGSTAYSKEKFSENNIKVIDALRGELEPAFKRDPILLSERGYENSITTKGSTLKYAIADNDVDISKTKNFVYPMSFSKTSSAASGLPCSAVSIPYSASHVPYFKYSTLHDAYVRYQYGDVHTDTKSDLIYTNVIVMFAESYKADDSGELDFELYGQGDGYYINSGKYIPVVWMRTVGEPIRFFEKNGSVEITFEQGKTFISLCPNSLKSKVSIT